MSNRPEMCTDCEHGHTRAKCHQGDLDEVERLERELHRMRVMLGGLKGLCERSGNDYALRLVLAALGDYKP